MGDLVAFMHAYNLRFGPATSERQIEIYSRLVPPLTAIRDEPSSDKADRPALDRTGEGLRSAAKSAFKWMELGPARGASQRQVTLLSACITARPLIPASGDGRARLPRWQESGRFMAGSTAAFR